MTPVAIISPEQNTVEPSAEVDIPDETEVQFSNTETDAAESIQINDDADNSDAEFDFDFELVKPTDSDDAPDKESSSDNNQGDQQTSDEDEGAMDGSLITDEESTSEEAEESREIEFEPPSPQTNQSKDNLDQAGSFSDTASANNSTDSSMKDMETKIALAKIYVEMQDEMAAKDTLDDVLSHGNDQQKKEAQSLLNSL